MFSGGENDWILEWGEVWGKRGGRLIIRDLFYNKRVKNDECDVRISDNDDGRMEEIEIECDYDRKDMEWNWNCMDCNVKDYIYRMRK